MDYGLGKVLQDVACFLDVAGETTLKEHVLQEVAIPTFHDEAV